jgi:hypothetical protein
MSESTRKHRSVEKYEAAPQFGALFDCWNKDEYKEARNYRPDWSMSSILNKRMCFCGSVDSAMAENI